MKLTLTRCAASPTETRGALFIGGEYVAPTIEPPALGEHPCIPAGSYMVVVTKSPRFGKPLPLLLGVKGRSGIRIHGGSRPEHTQGCICVPLAKMPAVMNKICSAINRNEDVSIHISNCGDN